MDFPMHLLIITSIFSVRTTSYLCRILHKVYKVFYDAEPVAVLISLEVEAQHPQLPFFTDAEADIVRRTIAPHNRTLSNIIMRQYYPQGKLCPLTSDGLRQFLHHRFWSYRRGPHDNDIPQPNHDYDETLVELRIFVMFVYHKYIDSDDYHFPQVLCNALSQQVNDILRKLITEASNFLRMEIYARESMIPGLILPFTPNMEKLLFIMVCRHFAYGGTINKVIQFQT